MHLNDNQLDIDLSFINMLQKTNIKGVLNSLYTQGLMMHLNDNQLDIDLSFINMLQKTNIKGVLNSL